ncbi:MULTISPECIES: branched-chain amino acid aminotransferase [unclassified Sphingomonas]|uniref:branched-chain amino acid aminotransferase n=1 Tax=unclassified Sphingomonas TaxID=196159 RepID=UPI00082E8823|nr:MULTISPECIES: branched-chain amino acid aminotransferase [unclassified Sphingomonas]
MLATATHAAPSLVFQHDPHPAPRSADERAALLAAPVFGRAFSDHMVVVRYSEGQGWHDARVQARGPIPMDPASSVLHYAQEIFEGLKAYRLPDGGAALFRPDANARRFRESAERLAMPPMPEAIFLDAVREMVRIDHEWIPAIEGGSLYLRPFMFASEVFLGVKPASEYLFIVIASPVGPYFRGDSPSITIWTSQQYTRAAPGGTGAAKCGGNYAASLIAQAEATRQGCDQVVFLDAVERRYVEELGGMNLFFVFDDGTLRTPPLGGTILPGITRSSLMMLARDAGMRVEEAPYAIDQWEADARSGHLREAFACGTAAVVTPIGRVRGEKVDFTIGNAGPGTVTGTLRERLVAIQRGIAPDPHGWVERVI